MSPSPIRSADVFCAVVDNFGDAGFCWRLARVLLSEHAIAVRLWIDSPVVLARMVPAYDPASARCVVDGVTVVHWRQGDSDKAVALPDAVFETFGCGLPDTYLQAMNDADRPPVWVNIEHLSAETWVDGFHGLPSPQPHGSLVRHFFFPGFDRGTGGLLREGALLARRDAFRRDATGAKRLFDDLGVARTSDHALTMSLFAYAQPGIGGLLDAWATGEAPIACVVPEGSLASEITSWSGTRALEPGTTLRRGNLQLSVIPFSDQDRYDELLWACDINFVRGEDSFVRAQWAARPLLWQAYRQHEDSHLAKVRAFSTRYTCDLAADAAGAWRSLVEAWNTGAELASHWPPMLRHAATLATHATQWAHRCRALPEASATLVEFAAARYNRGFPNGRCT